MIEGLILNVAGNLNVRPEANNFILNLPTEPPHDREREQESRHPQRDPPDCNVRNEAEEAAAFLPPLGPPQVPEGHEALKLKGHEEK